MRNNLTEAEALMAELVDAYPQTQQPTDSHAARLRDFLAVLPPGVGREVVEEVLRTERFFPSYASVHQSALKRLCTWPPTDTAWSLVQAVLDDPRRSGGFSALPPCVQAVARRVGWFEIRTSGNRAVEAGMFRRLYQECLDEHRDELSKALREQVHQLTESRKPKLLPAG